MENQGSLLTTQDFCVCTFLESQMPISWEEASGLTSESPVDQPCKATLSQGRGLPGTLQLKPLW